MNTSKITELCQSREAWPSEVTHPRGQGWAAEASWRKPERGEGDSGESRRRRTAVAVRVKQCRSRSAGRNRHGADGVVNAVPRASNNAEGRYQPPRSRKSVQNF